MKSWIPASAVALGMILLASSFLWGILFPPTRTWNEDKSKQMSEIGSKANLLKFAIIEAQQNPQKKPPKPLPQLQAEYDQLTEEYKGLQQEFAGATNSPKRAASFLRWSGVAFVIAGGCIVLANRP
jgi:hypothetical protein